MSRKGLIIAAAGAAAVVIAASFITACKKEEEEKILAGTPVIIKGGGDGDRVERGPKATIKFVGVIPASEENHRIKSEIDTIRIVGASGKCMIYKYVVLAKPKLEITTYPSEYAISMQDEVNENLHTHFTDDWDTTDGQNFESKNPTYFTELKIIPGAEAPATVCTDGTKDIVCYDRFPNRDWPAAEMKGFEIWINEVTPECK